jgi:predicted TIM-barrel fold metal-dependent hydrolase
MGEQTEKVLIVSSDGHCSALMRDYRSYIDPEFSEDFDRYLAAFEKSYAGVRFLQPKFLFGPNELDDFFEYMIESGAFDGLFDPHLRAKELGSQGVVAEALFPDIQIPFAPLMYESGSEFVKPEMVKQGHRAYNRWLADFVAERPEQYIGQAMVHFDDVDEAVATVVWAKENGLRSVILPNVNPNAARLHWDPALDRFWSAIEDTGLVANCHPNQDGTQVLPLPDSLDVVVPARIVGDEFPYFSHRCLSLMMWSGVFERHPRLRVAFTEQYASWVPQTLEKWDWQWERDRRTSSPRMNITPRKPSEYFAEHCWVGSSLTSRAEIDHRHEIGMDNIMFGADFPHFESTYPKTLATLQTLCAGVPDDEVRKFLGLNAVEFWGLDVDALAPRVDEVGYTMDELRQAPSPDAKLGNDVNRPFSCY